MRRESLVDAARALNAEFGVHYRFFVSTCIYGCGCGGRLWASRRGQSADCLDADSAETMRGLILARLGRATPVQGGSDDHHGGGGGRRSNHEGEAAC